MCAKTNVHSFLSWLFSSEFTLGPWTKVTFTSFVFTSTCRTAKYSDCLAWTCLFTPALDTFAAVCDKRNIGNDSSRPSTAQPSKSTSGKLGTGTWLRFCSNVLQPDFAVGKVGMYLLLVARTSYLDYCPHSEKGVLAVQPLNQIVHLTSRNLRFLFWMSFGISVFSFSPHSANKYMSIRCWTFSIFDLPILKGRHIRVRRVEGYNHLLWVWKQLHEYVFNNFLLPESIAEHCSIVCLSRRAGAVSTTLLTPKCTTLNMACSAIRVSRSSCVELRGGTTT